MTDWREQAVNDVRGKGLGRELHNPWVHYGTVYMAVEVMADGRAEVVRNEQPGKRWRPIVSELREWVAGGMGADRKGAPDQSS